MTSRPPIRGAGFPCGPTGSARETGFTIAEILVAMGIFVVLGAALITILKQGLDLWRKSEERKQAYETANFILSQIREDLVHTYSGTGETATALFLCDLEPANEERGMQRQILRFVRARRGESQHPIASQGGTVLLGDSYFDHIDDVEELRSLRLRAGAGLEEVAYLLDPDPEETFLWRGVRSPPGGEGSLLDVAASPGELLGRSTRLAAGVLHLEFRFWTQHTDTWDDLYFPKPLPHDEEGESGPALLWDSTRAIIPPEAGAPRNAFRMHLGPQSRNDRSDDIFPRQVLVTLVIETEDRVELAENITSGATRIPLRGASRIPDDAPRYVRIENEWIRYTRVEGGRLILDTDADPRATRGARWTMEKEHKKGTPVRIGRTFTLTVRVPSYREDWNR